MSQPSPEEKTIFKKSFPTSRSFEDLVDITNVPLNVRGLRILDIGGGASDFTDNLLVRGADAYAIDPHYQNKSVLISEINKNIVELQKSEPDYAIRLRKAKDRFCKSFKIHRDHYLPLYATDTGFPNNFFNGVYSFNCLTQFLDLDYDVFINAVREAVRITVVGGTISSYPFREFQDPILLSRTPAYSKELKIRAANQEKLLEELGRDSSIKYGVFPVERSNHMMLEIKKLQ